MRRLRTLGVQISPLALIRTENMPLTTKEKEDLIERLLYEDDDTGREELARQMVFPLRRVSGEFVWDPIPENVPYCQK